MMIVDVLLFGLKRPIIESKIALSFINAPLPTLTKPPQKKKVSRKRKTLIDIRPNAQEEY